MTLGELLARIESQFAGLATECELGGLSFGPHKGRKRWYFGVTVTEPGQWMCSACGITPAEVTSWWISDGGKNPEQALCTKCATDWAEGETDPKVLKQSREAEGKEKKP